MIIFRKRLQSHKKN